VRLQPASAIFPKLSLNLGHGHGIIPRKALDGAILGHPKTRLSRRGSRKYRDLIFSGH
jgi:hypothetical protein